MARLDRGFFERRTPEVARALLGNLVVHVVDGRRLSGRILEVEAYRGKDDPASHAFKGRTGRNAVMFGEGGHAYIYFSYGSHWCLNVTTERPGAPGAVLIRAVEPVEGVALMRKNRGSPPERSLADGPGKLTRALGIDSTLNGEDMVTSERLFIETGEVPARVGSSPRIGITKGTDREWRFFIVGEASLSKRGTVPRRTHN